jgi:hypothetical protein
LVRSEIQVKNLILLFPLPLILLKETMTKTILTYCSLPLLYSLHSVFTQAIEKRWSQFPNRYKDANVDIIYQRENTYTEHIEEDDTLRSRDRFYHRVRFLRPPRLDLNFQWDKGLRLLMLSMILDVVQCKVVSKRWGL